jgi:hypothetical protein
LASKRFGERVEVNWTLHIAWFGSKTYGTFAKKGRICKDFLYSCYGLVGGGMQTVLQG